MPLSPAGVDAVLFDAGGVLVLPDPDAMRRALRPLGADPDNETCRRAHYVSMHAVDHVHGPDWGAVDRVLARVAGVPEDNLDATLEPIEGVYLREPWVPVDGAAEALRALQAAGYPLAVVSNAQGTMEAQLAEHRICSVQGGASALVAVVVDSSVVGVEKPDPAIFKIALDTLDVAPERCVYVGDTVYFDVLGARAAGLEPLHLDPYGLCDAPDHGHLVHLSELVTALTGAS